MDFIDLASTRRSIRNYSSRKVPRQILDRCFEAAGLAPSACNSQPWSFVCVDSSPLKEPLGDVAFSGIYSMNAFARKAPVLIAAIREKPKASARFGGMLMGTDFSLFDLGSACEHFCLQAAEEGVGTCMLGWFNKRGARRVLGLDRFVRVHLMISAGYTEEPLERPKSRKPMDEVRRYAP